MTFQHPGLPTATAGTFEEDGRRLGKFARRHPLLTLMLVFNTFGQALVFMPTVLNRTYGTAQPGSLPKHLFGAFPARTSAADHQL
jgi:hypothetical protein